MRQTALVLLVLGLAPRALSQDDPARREATPPSWRSSPSGARPRSRRSWRECPTTRPPRSTRSASRLAAMRARLARLDAADLTATQRTDRALVEAEMNGLDFDLRVLQPWSRNPAFYAMAIGEQSDTPLREGPTIEGAIELWRLALPLPAAERAGAARAAARDPDAARRRLAPTSPGTRATCGWSASARTASRPRSSPPSPRGCARTTRSWCRTPFARARPRTRSAPGSRPGSRRSTAAPASAARATTGTCGTSTSCPTPGRTSWC